MRQCHAESEGQFHVHFYHPSKSCFIFIIAVRKMNIPYETKHRIHVKVTQKAARFVVDTVGLRLSDGDWAPLNVF